MANVKLSEADVSEIVAHIISRTRNSEIAKKYGVTNGLVSSIRHGRLWSHLISVEQYRLMKECGTNPGNPDKCKLTHDEVVNIRNLVADGMPPSIVAKKYNVGVSNINQTIRRKIWRKVA